MLMGVPASQSWIQEDSFSMTRKLRDMRLSIFHGGPRSEVNVSPITKRYPIYHIFMKFLNFKDKLFWLNTIIVELRTTK